VIGDVPKMVDVLHCECNFAGNKGSEKTRTVSGWLSCQAHAITPPLDTKRDAVGRASALTKSAKADGQEGRPFRVSAVAPLHEIDPVRVFVVEDVSV
jgi:hypothetical protein